MNRDDAAGAIITSYEVLNSTRDNENRRLGAELLIKTAFPNREAGTFVLSLVTKKHYIFEEQEKIHEQLQHPELYFDLEEEPAIPFVLNDDSLSDDVLEQKISGRTIGPDMVPSLSEVTDEP